MDTNIWTERTLRIVNKTIWSTTSVFNKPRVDVLHHKDPSETPEITEFIHRCNGPAFIEPEWGYVISGNGVLLEDSLLPNFVFPKSPWRIACPSFTKFSQTRDSKHKKVLRLERAISLRHFWEWNYYHFYLDTLGKLSLIDAAGIDRSIPLVLGRYAHQLPFVKQVISMGGLKDRNWILPTDEYVQADEIYYCRTGQNYKRRLDFLLDEMGAPNRLVEFADRIFLSRGKNSTRHITNIDQVEAAVKKHGFRVVTTEGLSIAEQIDLFSKARHLISIHGAGITNIIFRRDAPLSVLELHSPGYLNFDFRRICQESGYAWDHLSGPAEPGHFQHANFFIDVEALQQKIETMVQQG